MAFSVRVLLAVLIVAWLALVGATNEPVLCDLASPCGLGASH